MQGVADRTAREKILRATIAMIDAGNAKKLTVREISKNAGVNIGAVNYYFGAKKELMIEAARELMKSTHKSFSALDDKTLPALERLEGFLVDFINKFVIRHQFFSREFFGQEHHSRDDHEMMKKLNGIGIGKIKETIMELDGELDEAHAALLAIQLFSAAIIPNIIFTGRHGDDQTPEPREISIEEQVRGLLERMFGAVRRAPVYEPGSDPNVDGGSLC